MNTIRRLALGCLAALALPLAGCTKSPPVYKGIDVSGTPYRSAFTLTAADGVTRSLDDFAGKYVMVFFGYTQCPDVCPTALARALEVRQRLGRRKDMVQVVFITIDPERDTPEVVRAYVRAFDPAFVGLSGTAAQTARAAANYRIVYRKVPNGPSYDMEHTALTFMVDPRRRVRLAFPHAQSAQDCADDIGKLIASDLGT
jgi:protein SCO1/2